MLVIIGYEFRNVSTAFSKTNQSLEVFSEEKMNIVPLANQKVITTDTNRDKMKSIFTVGILITPFYD